MTTLREAAQRLLETCEERLPLMGQARIIDELNDLRAALAKRQSGWDRWQAQKQGCSVCGIGANNQIVGYVCTRNDCPTRVTCGDAP